MKTSPPYFIGVTAIVSTLLAIDIPLQASPINFPGPGEEKIKAEFSLMDQSDGRWDSVAATMAVEDTGFVATFAGVPGETFTINGTFEQDAKKDEIRKATIRWAAADGYQKAFLMLVLSFPVDSVETAELVSKGKDISVPKLLKTGKTRNHFDGISSFTFGPWDEHQVKFDFETPIDLSAVVLGDQDFFQIRLKLTTKDSAFPPEGEVAWTMTWSKAKGIRRASR